MSGAAPPKGWSLVELGALGVFLKGSGIRKDEAQSGEIPAVRYGELYTDHQEILRAHRSFISQAVSKTARPIRHGDILFAGSGETKEEIGKCTGFLGDYEAFAGGGVIIFRPSGADPTFLAYLLNSRPLAQQKAQRAQGDAVVHIYPDALSALRLPLPPLPEQQAIAAALSDADRVVAGLERVIAKKRLIKQGAMQDLLTARRRLPGFSGEWGITSLGAALRRSPSYGINAPAIPRGTGGFAYLRITDISENGTVDPSGLPSVRESASDQYLLAEGDIVVARTGASVGKSHLFRDIGEPVIFAGFLIRLCPDETKLLPSFLSQFMQTQIYWDWVRENSARSGQPGVNGQQLRTILLKLPEIEEQQAIAAVLSDMDAEIQTLESRLAKARAVKEGMMQNLLTGRVRLV